ncbi:metallophosphoesterase family protein [Ralstonia pickettii]|uniref:metallophosphoesterase family protein n=1 Tax=Ralstonia pickettii TaxID=329 RepID=UPI0015B944F7|nr:metallophosphoesterase [Ralstonia pickettii]NWK43456.1 metallophosphoesterase [Ralstonia pickettii]
MPKIKPNQHNTERRTDEELETQLRLEEEAASGTTIATDSALLIRVVTPLFGIFFIYSIAFFFLCKLLSKLPGTSLLSVNAAFIIFTCLIVLSAFFALLGSRLYERRFTAPLWYVILEWSILASVFRYTILLFLPTKSSLLASIGAFLILAAGNVIHRLRVTGRPWTYATGDMLVMAEEVLIFYAQISGAIIRRIALIARSCIKAAAFSLERRSDSIGTVHAFERWDGAAHALEPGTLRVAHLSDLHLRPQSVGGLEHGDLLDKELQEATIEAVRDHQPDIVVISGDITDTGSARDFEEANRFFSALRTKLGSDVPVIAVPGNHDLAINPCVWGVGLPGWRGAMVRVVGSCARPFFSSYSLRRTRFEKLATHVGMQSSASLTSTNLFNYPQFKLSVITLSTPIENSWLLYNGVGAFPQSCIDELKTLKHRLQERVIVVCHHHLRTPEGDAAYYGGKFKSAFKHAHLCAVGSTRLADTLLRDLGLSETNCVVLHGHTHIPRRYQIEARDAIGKRIGVVGAPSAFERASPGFLLHAWQDKGISSYHAKWNALSRVFE